MVLEATSDFCPQTLSVHVDEILDAEESKDLSAMELHRRCFRNLFFPEIFQRTDFLSIREIRDEIDANVR